MICEFIRGFKKSFCWRSNLSNDDMVSQTWFLSRKTVWIFRGQGQVFFESPDHYVCRVCIQHQIFNNFENDTMKVSVNEAKLTGL